VINHASRVRSRSVYSSNRTECIDCITFRSLVQSIITAHAVEAKMRQVRWRHRWSIITLRQNASKEHRHLKKGKGFPYSLPSVGPGADPGVEAVSPKVTMSNPPSGRLPLHSARLAVTLSVTEHHRSLASTRLYCKVTEAHRCEQLVQGCYAAIAPSRI